MKKASSKAYVSGRKMERYQQERARIAGSLPTVLQPISEQAELESRATLHEGDAVMREAVAEEMKAGPAKKEAELASDDEESAEELDSDDLEDEIKEQALPQF